MLRRIFGSIRNRITGEWRELHNDDLYDLHSSNNVIRVIKLRRIILKGLIASTVEGKE
jgi:hypothetical protein